jgi:hypothetical protein
VSRLTLRPPGTDVTYILAEEATINKLRTVFDSDSVVPLEDHSLRLAQRLGESVHLQVIPGGEHGTGDLRYLETMPPKALCAYLELLSS